MAGPVIPVSLIGHDSWDRGGEVDSRHACTLVPATKSRNGWFALELTCIDSESHWHSEDPDQNGTTESTESVMSRWDGAGYQEHRRKSTPPEKHR